MLDCTAVCFDCQIRVRQKNVPLIEPHSLLYMEGTAHIICMSVVPTRSAGLSWEEALQWMLWAGTWGGPQPAVAGASLRLEGTHLRPCESWQIKVGDAMICSIPDLNSSPVPLCPHCWVFIPLPLLPHTGQSGDKEAVLITTACIYFLPLWILAFLLFNPVSFSLPFHVATVASFIYFQTYMLLDHHTVDFLDVFAVFLIKIIYDCGFFCELPLPTSPLEPLLSWWCEYLCNLLYSYSLHPRCLLHPTVTLWLFNIMS